MPVIAWLLARWPLCVAAIAGGAAVWFLKPNPQPKIHEVATLIEKQAVHEEDTTHADVGGWTRTTYEFGALGNGGRAGTEPVPGGPSAVTSSVAPAAPNTGQLLSVTVEQHDPVVIERHSVVDQHQETAQKLDLTIAPAQAGWALQVGLEDVLHAKTLRLAARRRLFGPIWVELAAVPAGLRLGAAVGVEF